MQIIGTYNDVEQIKALNYDPMIIEYAFQITSILDEYYGKDRDIYKDSGGYLVIMETVKDLDTLMFHTGGIPLKKIIFEFVEEYSWGYDCLFFKGTEFGVTIVFLNVSLTPEVQAILKSDRYSFP